MIRDLAGRIDHTLLRPEATRRDIERLCAEAIEHRFATVCVNPVWVPECVRALAGSPVAVCSVIAFPLGAQLAELKAHEARRLVELGARELDMVMNVGAMKAGDSAAVESDIRAVVATAGSRAMVKVILETSLLSREEIVGAARLARAAGAAFVKTSTGFGAHGATVEDVRLLRETVGADMGVKASGGIRTAGQAMAMIHAGATRIGTSAGVAIVAETVPQAPGA
jgi:deoxyribose-phosphate aldolase